MSTFFPILRRATVEPLPEARESGLHARTFRKRCVDFHWHFHPELEMVHVTKGRGVRYVGRSVEPFSDGDFCLIGSNLPHAFGSHPAERQGAEWTVAHFLPGVWGAPFWELPETRRVSRLFHDSRQGVVFRGNEARHCAKLLRKVEQTPRNAQKLSDWLEILHRLASSPNRRLLNLLPESHQAATDARLSNLLAWVAQHASSAEISQAAAARRLGMSPAAFSRYFRGRTGKVFHLYVNEVRVARGCSDLLHSDARISEVAFRSGFNNLSNFNRRFREITGQTPHEYRRIQGGLE